MSDIKVSVVVATYNQAATLGRALDSVLAQKCDFDFEIIVGEDCSTDGTLAVARRYAEACPGKIRLLARTENMGVVDNYFDCVKQARGCYIADCAGDDYWVDEHKLQKQVDIMERDGRVTLVHTAWRYLHPDGSLTVPMPPAGRFAYREPLIDGRAMLEPFLTSIETPVPLIHLCTALYSRAVAVAAIDADPESFSGRRYPCEDVQLTMAMLAAGDVAFIDDVTLHYSVGHPSISSSEDCAKTFDFYYGVLSLKMKLMKRYGLDTKSVRKAFSPMIHYTFTQAWHANSRPRRDAILRLAHDHKIPLTLKSRVLKLIFR